MSKLKTNLSDTFIGKIWKFLWVLLEEEGGGEFKDTQTLVNGFECENKTIPDGGVAPHHFLRLD